MFNDPQCHFCGHRPHPDACPRTIQRGTVKNPDETPCPCVKRDPT